MDNQAKKTLTEKIVTAIVLVLFIVSILWLSWLVFFDGGAKRDFGPNSTSDTIDQVNQDNDLNKMAEREIKETDGVKHSVPLEEIIGGGPPKDGIPSIDNPKFVSVSEADYLSDNDPGMVVDIDGVQRFYPYQILVWHEVVNDTINGRRVLVTYCPLCFSGIVYDPTVDGEQVEFGTSGKLWESNLVMYDRKTDSYWSQILGEAIVGEKTGTKLKVLPSDLAKFGDWKKQYPAGQVLSRETGATRTYGTDPYGDYYSNNDIFFPVSKTDERLDPKEFIFGIVTDTEEKAYPIAQLKKAGEVEDTVAGRTFVFKFESDIDAVRVFEKKADGKLERFNPINGYWFSWIAAYPESKLYESAN